MFLSPPDQQLVLFLLLYSATERQTCLEECLFRTDASDADIRLQIKYPDVPGLSGGSVWVLHLAGQQRTSHVSVQPVPPSSLQ